MNEVTVNMDNLTAEEREQLLALVEKGNKKPFEVWKPAESDMGYRLHGNGLIFRNISVFYFDKYHERGFCAKTEEELKFIDKQRIILTQYKRLAEESWAGEVINWDSQSQAKHYLYFGENKIYSCVDYHKKNQGTIYFKTFKDLIAAIETIGEENIIKYLF